MKTLFTLVTTFAALGVLAQNPPAPTPVDPFPPPAPEPPIGAAVPRTVGKTKRVEVKPGSLPGFAGQVAVAPGGVGGGQGGAVSMNAKGTRFSTYGAGLPRSAKTGRTLVIQTSDPNPDALTDAEEDLSVMAVILRKATGVSQADDKRMALGIEVDSSVFGSSSGARNIYVEGYGALFLLGVRFPLIAPQDDVNDTKVKTTESSDWAEAREELLNSERDGIEAQIERIWVAGGRQPTEDYDDDKVEQLKGALLDSLKNATHIRALKPEDNITVVVQGGEVTRKGKSASSRKIGTVRAPVGSRSRSDSRRSETVMTMRVKKADVDNFAKGSLDAEGFRKRVSVQTYLRSADSSVATSLFSAPK
jgi:hypothetical protein